MWSGLAFTKRTTNLMNPLELHSKIHYKKTCMWWRLFLYNLVFITITLYVCGGTAYCQYFCRHKVYCGGQLRTVVVDAILYILYNGGFKRVIYVNYKCRNFETG